MSCTGQADDESERWQVQRASIGLILPCPVCRAKVELFVWRCGPIVGELCADCLTATESVVADARARQLAEAERDAVRREELGDLDRHRTLNRIAVRAHRKRSSPP